MCQTIFDVMSLGGERMEQRELGWYTHPKGEDNMAVCGFGSKNLTSLGLHAVFKCDLLARAD